MHINQFLARATGISRRAAEVEIRAKKVRRNGAIALVTDRVEPSDRVEWKGRVVVIADTPVRLIMLNKPAGYVSSRKRDETDAPTVMELLPREYHDLKPLGRLDKDSEGLLLLTDDGDLLYSHTHPKFETEKEYEVEFDAEVTDAMIARMLKGIRLREGVAQADRVTRVGRKKLRIVIHQGMNRQIRRMAAEVKNSVALLRRTRVGNWSLGKLGKGKWTQVSTKQ